MTALGIALLVAYALGSAALEAWTVYRARVAIERITASYRGTR